MDARLVGERTKLGAIAPQRARLHALGVFSVLMLCALTPFRARADAPPGLRLTLEEAVAFALDNHPTLRAAQARERAADARVDEARAAELPDLGVTAELNRSSSNAVAGSFFPAPGFPLVSGAPKSRSLDAGVFQSGVSVWATWDVTSFVRQSAAVDVAGAERTSAAAASADRKLAVEVAVADAFLGLVAAHEAVNAARASVNRARVLTSTVQPLVEQQLRPGVDAARAQAELALAQTLLSRAEQTEEVRRAQLAQALGAAGRHVEAIPGGLLAPVGNVSVPATPSADHPLLAERDAEILRADREKRATALEYLPRVSLLASLWLRGSGLGPAPGPIAGGVIPDTPNWAAGVVASWSVLDLPEVGAKNRVASARQAVATAKRDEAKLALTGELAAARAQFLGAVRVAQNTAPAVAAARAASSQAKARYEAGLAPVIDVADAQRLLAQAELEDVVARVEVRRALLLVARASGDFDVFLAATRGGG
jgi:outer membrane protein TolC